MANIETIKEAFERDDTRKRFQEMLGKKSTGFIVSVINTVTNDKNLALAERNSILFAAATAAALDLPINPNLGLAYIVPYKGKDGIQRAQFQLGYKGFVQLSMRSGQFLTINAVPVYEGDEDESVRKRLTSIITPIAPSDKVMGYAAYFKLVNGFEKTHYMSVEELRKHGKKYSQSFKKGYGLWEDEFHSMATKTVIKLLLSKFAPLSIEMARAVQSDQAIIKDFEGNTLDYEDNRIGTADEVSKEKETARIRKWIEDSDTLEKLQEANESVYTSENDDLIDLYEAKLQQFSNDLSI